MKIKIKEVSDFIVKVFNYYNGRINTCNPCILRINTNRCIRERGRYTLPNLITILPYSHENASTKNMMYADLINTVIHELYHADQLFDYSDYDINEYSWYIDYIENSVMTQTSLYMLSHANEIRDVFGVNIYTHNYKYAPTLKATLHYSNWAMYQRRNIFSHFSMCINSILNKDLEMRMKFNMKFNKMIMTKIGNASIQINDYSLVFIRDGMPAVDINTFNQFVYLSWFINETNRYKFSSIENQYDIHIDVISISRKCMCTIKED